MLSWSSDAFTNWLTQNAVNLTVNAISSAITSTAQIASGDVGGGIGNLASSIGQTIGSINQASLLPNTAEGNANSGDVSFAFNLLNIKFMRIRAKTEYLKSIDNYFSMYGYKTNLLKIPNITGRQNWNYVKTIGANIIGNIPQEDLQTIKNMFDSGVTFWHNYNTFLDYSQTNNILGD